MVENFNKHASAVTAKPSTLVRDGAYADQDSIFVTKHHFKRLNQVVAVIGCDGAGKSTLTADLYTQLNQQFPTEILYLGQDSGNILRAIIQIPVIGKIIGRFLVKRSQKAHGDKEKTAVPDGLTALVVHLLSQWRFHKFKRMLAQSDSGTLILTDRYPQAEVPGFYFDGPGLDRNNQDYSRLVRWLARREQRLYESMAKHVPALVIRVNIDAETAHARKPDHKLSMLQDKVRVIPSLHFNNAEILDLDGTSPYPKVLETALKAVRQNQNLSSSN